MCLPGTAVRAAKTESPRPGGAAALGVAELLAAGWLLAELQPASNAAVVTAASIQPILFMVCHLLPGPGRKARPSSGSWATFCAPRPMSAEDSLTEAGIVPDGAGEVADDRLAAGGEDRLGVELNSLG